MMHDSPLNSGHAKGRILLVEQETGRRQQLYELLSGQGYSVQGASSRTTALDALEHDWPDLILTSHALPDATGLELAQHVRRLHDSVPILVLGHGNVAAAPREIQASLPADADDGVLLEAVARWLRPQEPRKQRMPCSVLVVDDEPKLRLMLQRFLEMHNFTVLTAASGEEALKVLERRSPMFVLLDVGMDGMDGLVTLKKIKALPVPTNVIMVTGNSEDETMKQAMALGAQDYINKPFSPAYLESILLSKLYTG